MLILKPGFHIQGMKTNGLILLTLHYFTFKILLRSSRYDKRKDCIVYLECQLALFLKTSSFGTICEEPTFCGVKSV